MVIIAALPHLFIAKLPMNLFRRIHFDVANHLRNDRIAPTIWDNVFFLLWVQNVTKYAPGVL